VVLKGKKDRSSGIARSVTSHFDGTAAPREKSRGLSLHSMGAALCGKSNATLIGEFYRDNPQYRDFEASFDALKLSGKSLRALHETFENMDFDCSGEISIKEFFRYLGVRRTAFSKRCFCLFDYDNSGELDFREFVVSLWNYCTSDSYALMSFSFDLYDLDNSGMISNEEMVNVCKEVYGKDIENNKRAKNIIEKLQRSNRSSLKGGDQLVDIEPECTKEGFVQFCKRHPALLFPAFMLQETLRNELLGRAFWKKLATNREREFGKEEIDINWLRARVTRNAFVEIAETIGFGEERQSLRSKVLSREDSARYSSIEHRLETAKKELNRRKRDTTRKLKKRRRQQFGNKVTRPGQVRRTNSQRARSAWGGAAPKVKSATAFVRSKTETKVVPFDSP